MRTTQFRGLPKEAINFLDQMAIKETIFPKGWATNLNVPKHFDEPSYIEGYRHALHDYLPKSFITKPIGIVDGMFGEEVHTLLEYKLTDGNWVEEYIQAEPWSSGPVIFLALRYKNTKEIIVQWSDEEINNI